MNNQKDTPNSQVLNILHKHKRTALGIPEEERCFLSLPEKLGSEAISHLCNGYFAKWTGVPNK